MNKKGLGRGLQALLPGIGEKQDSQDSVVEISVKDIVANRNQPRNHFDEAKLEELANSVREHGVVQPIIVRDKESDIYEIVAGERRWRAAIRAGLEKVPAIIKKLTEKETQEIALIENIQREDLSPLDEAKAFKALMDEYGLTQEELSRRVGKSRPFIANSVRLLTLPDRIKELLARGDLTAGHARALLSLPKASLQEQMASNIVLKGLSVRQAEKAVKDLLDRREVEKKKKPVLDPIILDIEERLKTRLSTKVTIKHGKKGGKIEIEYYGDEELQRVLESILGDIEL